MYEDETWQQLIYIQQKDGTEDVIPKLLSFPGDGQRFLDDDNNLLLLFLYNALILSAFYYRQY